jgi:hypothetical protein
MQWSAEGSGRFTFKEKESRYSLDRKLGGPQFIIINMAEYRNCPTTWWKFPMPNFDRINETVHGIHGKEYSWLYVNQALLWINRLKTGNARLIEDSRVEF